MEVLSIGNEVFFIKTDHQSLKFLLEQRVTALMQQKWLTKLMGHDYELSYKFGKTNIADDALSRVEEEVQLLALTVVLCKWVKELHESWV